MSTTAARRGSRARAVPLVILTFLFAVLGLAGEAPAAFAVEPGPQPLQQVLEEADAQTGPQTGPQTEGDGQEEPEASEDNSDPGDPPPQPEPPAQADPPSDQVPAETPESAPAVPGSPGLADPRAPAPSLQDEIPLPEGQSDQPAPPSREKRVLENVHTDAVTAYLDDGELVAETQADVDGELRKRFAAQEVLFHLSDAGKRQIPAGSQWEFLGEPGDDFWHAPQVQNHDVIWPGFSTEDPNLRGQAAHLDVRMLDVQGPGRAELLLGGERIFSSLEDLGPWRINIPQHTHMDWVFTEPGTYTFTFEYSGTAAGREQSAQNDYTFVVGDLDVHTRASSVAIEASRSTIDPGDPVLFTANVEPANAAGVVQFRDLASGAVLGHTPVVDGQAQFRADELNPGLRRVIAEFIPTWSNDFAPSNSSSANVTVTGEVVEEPTHEDTEPVPKAEQDQHEPGTAVEVTSPASGVVTGYDVAARVTDPALNGQWLSVWIPGQNPEWRGWTQANQSGAFSVNLQGVSLGDHRLVVKDVDGDFVGWDSFRVIAPPTVDGGGPDGPGGSPGPGPGPGGPGGGGSTSPAAQACRPEVTLDHGHIDAFYVSSANGKAVMQLMEDVTGHRVLRQPETTLMQVKESALGTVAGAPSGVPSRGYWLPLSQDQSLIWPGWDTNTTRPSGHTDVSINITAVNGPGTVSVYSDGDWGAKKPLLNGGRYNLPGTIRESRPAHTHAHWVFSERGIYTLTAHAVATNSSGESLTTGTHTYVFQVGDVPLGDVFCGLTAHGAGDADAVNAAVDEHAAEALAATQVDSEEDESKRSGRNSRTGEGDETAGGLFSDIFGGDGIDPALLAGLLGLGGGLVISGIAGGTVWYVIRLRRLAPAVVAPAAA